MKRTIEFKELFSKSTLLASILMLPYLEIRKVRELLTLKSPDYSIPAISIIFAVLIPIVLLIFAAIGKRENQSKHEIFYSTGGLFLFLLLQIAFTFLITKNVNAFWNTLALFLPARILSVILFYFSSKDTNKAATDKFIYLFVVYLIGITFLWYLKYKDVAIAMSGGLVAPRLFSTGGGSVILGYTIAIVFPLLIEKYERKPHFVTFGMILAMYYSLILTGTRGGIWLTTIVFLFFLIRKWKPSTISTRLKKNRKLIAIFALLLLAVLVLIQGNEFVELLKRIINTDNTSRITTWKNSMDIYFKYKPIRLLIGSGIGNFYPYAKWFANENLQATNLFYVSGRAILVQPHNIYVHILLEGGLIGLITYLAPVWLLVYSIIKNRSRLNFQLWHFAGASCLIILLGLESILLITPGAALIWWFIIYYYTYKLNGWV